jgi:glycosyltransferase involved in cell wall biosynthesis
MIRTLPIVSVVIASYNAEKTIASCLESLQRQKADKGFEVIVIDSSQDGTGALVAEKFPWVQLHVFPKRKFCGDARNFVLQVAKGDIISSLDADCTADEKWVQNIIEAHEGPDLAIGGAIANAQPSGLVGWAAYFSEFSQWLPGSPGCRMEDIAGASMSYKKWIFGKLGLYIGGTQCSDTQFHWRLKAAGYSLRFEPSILVFHRSIDKMRKFLSHEFEHGRSFAHVRSRYWKFSLLRRRIYVLLFPLIFAKIYLKVMGHNLRNRIYLRYFLKSMPLIIMGIFAWSLGECAGYLKVTK